MNQLKRFSVLSIIVSLFFLAFNVSCLRGVNGGNDVSSSPSFSAQAIRSHDNENAGTAKNDFDLSNIDKVGEEIADQIVNGIVSALQMHSSASFVEGGATFDFKSEAKAQAKVILREVLRAGIAPLEEVIAKSIKPPTIPRSIYIPLKPVIKEVFNKVENAVKVQVPDDIWDIDEETIEEEEDEEESDDDDDDIDF